MQYCHVPSPVGDLLLAGSSGALELISFPTGAKARTPGPDWEHAERAFAEAATQLRAYFAGELRVFDLDIRLAVTPFQDAVLGELRRIPYGETRTYGDIAARIGRPKAVRAVGAANGNNPLPIVIPCHRVVGASGQLTGFGGGLETKRYLLALEKRTALG
ncbi:MAG: methylated-DNA--[protein]-cysteine S-methyltransferase [Gammaproteobacteria bacterium]|nr:methylated-DNA--[protein]-cysteine S-methyltransferase [Gammaproteobacteria bacterium]